MTGEDFPVGPDHWTDRDWEDYGARVTEGEGSARAIDAVQRRRRKLAEASQDGSR